MPLWLREESEKDFCKRCLGFIFEISSCLDIYYAMFH